MKKRLSKLFLAGIISGSMIFINSVFASAQEKIVKVSIGSNIANVDGNDITIDAVPYIQEKTNSTMIPLRFVATALDISENNIKFDATTKIITITKGNDIVEFKVNSNKYKKNGTTITTGFGTAEPTVEIKNGRTFVPFRTLAEAFNLEIEWESNTKTATIKNSKETNTINEVSASTTIKSTFDLFFLNDATESYKLGYTEQECAEMIAKHKKLRIDSLKSSFKALDLEISDEKLEEIYLALMSSFKKLTYSIEETASKDGKTKIVEFRTTYVDFDKIINSAAEKFVTEVKTKRIDKSKWSDTLANNLINEFKNYKPSDKVITVREEFSLILITVDGKLTKVWLPSNAEDFSMKFYFSLTGREQ
ncbi:MAG: copper amine oxidase N-terminal domain-containing protein [Eubacteriales bacterium]|nr:copper amine oxidase N-terminal domain-containing protein [Eubacteriales bacterium]